MLHQAHRHASWESQRQSVASKPGKEPAAAAEGNAPPPQQLRLQKEAAGRHLAC